MIEILRGRKANLRSHLGERAAQSGRALLIHPTDSVPVSWGGIRQLLAQARELLGQAAVEEVLDRHRVAASVVLHALEERLDEDEQAARRCLLARPHLHLSHTFLIQVPLGDAWADLLVDLLAGRGITLLVSDLHGLDRMSLSVLKNFYLRAGRSAPDLVLGFDPGEEEPQPDAEGLIWRLPRLIVQKTVFGFQSLADVDATDVGDVAGGEASAFEGVPSGTTGWELLDQDPEVEVWAELEANPSATPPELARRVASAQEAAFAAFDFTAALRLGLALLKRNSELAPAEKARVHGLIGLSAHNRQFQTQGNLRLAGFLARHFTAAYEAEARPLVRLAHLYRLAVTFGRRHKELNTALEWADRAVEAVAEAELSEDEKRHQEAWARNIRPYILMQLGRVQEAIDDGEAAFRLLEATTERLLGEKDTYRDVWRRELVLSQALIASNLASLGILRRDSEQIERWRRAARVVHQEFPELDRFEASNWVEFYIDLARPDLALIHALAGIDSARAYADGFLELRFTMAAAQLAYWLGRIDQSVELFQRARQLRHRFGATDEFEAVELPAARAELRYGRCERAQLLLEAVLDTEEQATPDRAEAHALLGLIAAERGAADEAESSVNRGIEDAVETGNQVALLRVALLAAATSHRLGRREEAIQAYRQALDIASAGDGEPGPAVSAGALVARAGLEDLGADGGAWLDEGLEFLDAALKEGEVWWVLKTLLTRLEEKNVTPQIRALLTRAAAQRDDCAAALERWGIRLEQLPGSDGQNARAKVLGG